MSDDTDDTYEVTTNDRGVKVGDLIVRWRSRDGFCPWITTHRLVTEVDSVGIWYDLLGRREDWHRFKDGDCDVIVRRKVLAVSLPTTLARPGKKAIPDWPLRCPRCQNANSAVLLFSSYDCKNGCYK